MSALSARASSGLNDEDLCLSCGLCCNGAIFADVKLQPGDDTAKLQAVGLRLAPCSTTRRKPAQGPAETSRRPAQALKFCQPCAAFDGCTCRIYSDRPAHCRNFECLQLKGVRTGTTTRAHALSTIRVAKKRVEKVRYLLRWLGDTDEKLALAARFRRTAHRLQAIGMDKPTAQIYGRLTLAVHDLNFILSDSFYPA